MWRTVQDQYSLEELYALLGVSRQAVHQNKKRKAWHDLRSQQVLDQVREIRKNHPVMGCRPLYYKLQDPGIGINTFEQLMVREGLTIPRRKKRIVTTQSTGQHKYKNLTNGLCLNDINQLVVGDITYYQSVEILFYIFCLKDAYSGRIVGLTGDSNMMWDKAMACLGQLIALRGEAALKGMIHHTDGGGQFRSKDYIKKLVDLHVRISQAGNCLENGCAEQCNHVVKNQYLVNEHITNVRELHHAMEKVKRLINDERPVKRLGYLTPVEFEEAIRHIPLEQRTIVQCYDFTANKQDDGFFKG